MSSEKLPVITDELIFALDQIFPNRHPDLSLSDRERYGIEQGKGLLII